MSHMFIIAHLALPALKTYLIQVCLTPSTFSYPYYIITAHTYCSFIDCNYMFLYSRPVGPYYNATSHAIAAAPADDAIFTISKQKKSISKL